MNKIMFATILSVATFTCACSPKPTAEKPQGVLTDAQKRTLENAKKTEEVLEKANKERLKQVDDIEGEK